MNTESIRPDTPADNAENRPHDESPGLPRLVIETHLRLGPTATPEQVTEDLRTQGVETTVEEVRSLWPEGGNLTG